MPSSFSAYVGNHGWLQPHETKMFHRMILDDIQHDITYTVQLQACDFMS